MTARVLMLQGTASDVGKSVVTAALCRIARRQGLSVAPFKPQNMSNNAAACADGGEIGRAQAMQAQAAGLAPQVDFNPVLLKPQTDADAQVVVHGEVVGSSGAADYLAGRGRLMGPVLESFERLIDAHDLVLVEGAGSPAEINLRESDIANMGFARRAGVPVCLVGDVDRGGVIASLVGTRTVLDPDDAAMICGFVVNKFRGDPQLFEGGTAAVAGRTGWPCFGVIPWIPEAALLPAEDSVVLDLPRRPVHQGLKVAAPVLPRLANFDDAGPLELEPGVRLDWVRPARPIPRDADIVILFGTKATLGDLAFLRAQGWDHDILAHARAGGRVAGFCGGYQMLGRYIVDTGGADGSPGEAPGLGLLNVETVMTSEKRVAPVVGRCAVSGKEVAGYEIHLGRTVGPDTERPLFRLGDRTDGARSPDERIEGTYVHGVFTNDHFRRAWIERVGGTADTALQHHAIVEQAIDRLADEVEGAIDSEALLRCAVRPGWSP